MRLQIGIRSAVATPGGTRPDREHGARASVAAEVYLHVDPSLDVDRATELGSALDAHGALAGHSLEGAIAHPPLHPRAVIALLEAISFWYRQPLHAVVDADAEGVRRNPEQWALLLGDAPELAVSVE